MKVVTLVVIGVLLSLSPLVMAAEAPRAGRPAAGDPSSGPQLRLGVFPDALVWETSIDYEKIVLTVAGPDGFRYTQDFQPGASIALDLTSKGVGTLPDGIYNYELSITPHLPRDIRAALDEVRDDEEAANRLIQRFRSAGDLPPRFQSGTFTVLNGDVLSPQAEGPEPASITDVQAAVAPAPGSRGPLADNVILDDQIVIGSLCVGFDCVDGESFGFDTLRLKENNLRIKFEDTSTSVGFPTNDWQITANDTGGGGAEKFSIDDVTGSKTPFTIEAGAPTHSLYVDDGGRIGLGTSTPVVNVHVVEGNTPTLRLEQDGSSGFSPQTWDVAGNETNFFVRDATGGSQLPFRIRSGADSNSIFIDSDNEVGVGTNSPDAQFHISESDATATNLGFHYRNSNAAINSGAGADVVITASGNLGVGTTTPGGTSYSGLVPKFEIQAPGHAGMAFASSAGFAQNFAFVSGTDDLWHISSRGTYDVPNNRLSFYAVGPSGTGVVLSLHQNGRVGIGTENPYHALHVIGNIYASGSVTSGSSRTLKENIAGLSSEEAEQTVAALEPVRFRYKADPNHEQQLGFIAEDVPDLVSTADRKGVASMDIVAVLTKVVQDLQKTVAQQRVELQRLGKLVEANRQK